MDATVTEIHAYPLRPEGYAEPLFHSTESRKEILDHLARSSWLSRASEAIPATGRTAHAGYPDEPVELSTGDGTPMLVRRGSRRRVTRILERWREVREWWSPGRGRDLVLYRVEVAGGASGGAREHTLVVDLARDRASGAWTLAGIVD